MLFPVLPRKWSLLMPLLHLSADPIKAGSFIRKDIPFGPQKLEMSDLFCFSSPCLLASNCPLATSLCACPVGSLWQLPTYACNIYMWSLQSRMSEAVSLHQNAHAFLYSNYRSADICHNFSSEFDRVSRRAWSVPSACRLKQSHCRAGWFVCLHSWHGQTHCILKHTVSVTVHVF